MLYTLEKSEELRRNCVEVLDGLQQLQLQIVVQGQPLDPRSRLREHLLHGAGRRIAVIRRSIYNIFTLFPPDSERPLNSETLSDVQINLHAFVMNLYGLYDNWAWIYVLRHDLEDAIGGRRRIGLFIEATRTRLPEVLRTYVASKREWHEDYAKSFRDALAHRIPPYIPPAIFNNEDGQRYNQLEREEVDCIRSGNWNRLEEVRKEKSELGTPCPYFLHAYTEDSPPDLLYLHPQVLSDAAGVIEFGSLFLEHWQKDA